MRPSSEITGMIVPLVTPFDKGELFDRAAMERLIEFVISEGANGLMPTALTGEGTLLTEKETLDVWDTVFENTAGRVPIMPTIISTTTRRAVELVRSAAERGATAVMVAPVMAELYAGRAYDDVYAFFSDVAAATDLPLILFNYPSLTGVDLTPALVARLAEIDTIRYIKESTGDTRRVHSIQCLVGDRVRVICGAPNVALESLSLGCAAWITGIMGAVPRSAKQLMRATQVNNDLVLARSIYYKQVLPLVDVMMNNCNPTGTIKAAISARGIDVGHPRRPGQGLGKAEQEKVQEIIRAIALAEVKGN